ncbi:hypothetical protein IV102_13965 [bacterium]|nr:hypothetical protein [bacterium]
MGTTIQAGNNYTSVTTSKTRFTKGPGEVTEAQGSMDSVSLGGAGAPPEGSQPVRFRDLDAATRSDYKETVQSLAGDGRLYVREDNGSLRRADPMEIKERLDHGQPVELVSRVASEREASGSSYSDGASKDRGVFSGGWNISQTNRSSSSSERVYYTSSPVNEWDSLEFASQGAGVKGVALLPASGNSVVISSTYEHEWNRRAHEQWGFFTEKTTVTNAGGFVRTHHTAD